MYQRRCHMFAMNKCAGPILIICQYAFIYTGQLKIGKMYLMQKQKQMSKYLLIT